MRLKTGELAPVFAQRDMYGRTVSLSQYWGRKLLLSFYRGAVCPLCNLRLRYLIDHYDDYRRQGLEMIVFFESSPEMARRYLDRQRPPFPIIPDLGRAVYSLYGLESSLFGALKARLMRGSAYREAARYRIGGDFWQNLLQMDGVFGRKPADFLLSPDLRIQSAFYGRDAGDFMPFAEIDRFLMTRAESPWPEYGQYGRASTSRYPGSGYSDPRGPTSGRSHPGPGRSAPGSYGSYPSGQSRPDNRRSGGSDNSGWDNSGW
jgi:thioredoxin-dependent peroxiredoxin